MTDKTQVVENTVGAILGTIEEAEVYESKRFARDRRMQRIDKFEKDFAKRLFAKVGSDSQILDVPCGSGRFFDVFSSAKSLTMVDYSENMLTATSERIGPHDNLQLVRADITSISLPDNRADICFCMRLFHHMKNDDVRLKALKELARISSKYVALSFYNRNCARYYWRKLLNKKIRGNYTTLAHIVGLAEQAGLDLLEYSRVSLVEQQCLLIFRKQKV